MMAYILAYNEVYANPWSPPKSHYYIVHIHDASEILKKDKMTKEFHDWMKANIRGGWYRHGTTFYENVGDVEDFVFTRQDSAMLFKMRWG